MAGNDVNNDRKWLFTSENDLRGNLFSKLAFDSAFNSKNEASPLSNAGDLLYDLMRSQHYEKKDPSLDIRHNDVHYEFTDFIVNTALYHKELDKSSEIGTRYEQVRQSLKQAAHASLNPNYQGLGQNQPLINIPQSQSQTQPLINIPQSQSQSQPFFNNPQSQSQSMLNNPQSRTQPNEYPFGSMSGGINGSSDIDWNNVILGLTTSESLPVLIKRSGLMGKTNDLTNIFALILFKLNYPEDSWKNTSFNNNVQSILDNIKKSKILYEFNNERLELTISDFINGLISEENGIVQKILSNQNLVSRNTDPNAPYALNDLVKIFEGSNQNLQGNLGQNFKQNFQRTLNDWINEISTELLKVINGKLQQKNKQNESFGTPSQDRTTAIADTLNEYIFRSSSQGSVSYLDTKIDELISRLFQNFRSVAQPQFRGQYVTLQSEYPRKFYENVYLKWNNFDRSTKDFYNKFISLRKYVGASSNTPDGWMEVPENELANAIKPEEYNNYRLNLNKTLSGRTIFGNSLPKFPKSLFGGIWYTTASGSKERISTDSMTDSQAENFFRDLYHQVYSSKDFKAQSGGFNLAPNRQVLEINVAGVTLRLVPTYAEAKTVLAAPYFSLKIDELIKNRLFKIAKAKMTTTPEYETKTYDFMDMDMNVWKRNADGDFVKNVDGKEIKYGANDPETEKILKANYKCYSTLVRAKNEDECRKYVFTCLLDENPDSLDKCLTDFKSVDFYDVAKKEIKDMHPIIAIRTLQRFGFRKHKVFDNQAGTQIYKVERVDHWLNNFMKKRFSVDEINKIEKGNDKLLAYLDLLSQFVNANPKILNKSYDGTTEEGVGYYKPTDFAKSLNIQPRREPSKVGSGIYELKLFKNQFDQYSQRAKISPFNFGFDGRINGPFGSSINPDVNVLIPIQSGGGEITDWALRKLNNQSMAEPVVGGRLIGEIFKGVLKDLSTRNKTLSKEDWDKLDLKIKNLINTEEELVRYIYFIEEYNKLLDVFRDNTSKVLKLEELQNLVQKFGKLKDKQLTQEQYLFKILEQLEKLISQEGDNADYERLIL
ncbi:Hypothetical protein KVN_LOCUS408 [uncultured virus]|nr:Hypothetical protein KVN_LOCUS408 [uncultured virus]